VIKAYASHKVKLTRGAADEIYKKLVIREGMEEREKPGNNETTKTKRDKSME